MASVIQKWFPVTDDFGFIHAPIEQVVKDLKVWSFSNGIEYVQTKIATSLPEAFESLLPLSHSKMRELFIATKSEWTACFKNGIQGSDPSTDMSQLSKRMGVMSMRVCSTPLGAKYPAVILEVYAPESLGGNQYNHRRSIAAANDGGKWVFEQSGEPFPFENIEAYGRTKKKDRFTREMLCEYLKHF